MCATTSCITSGSVMAWHVPEHKCGIRPALRGAKTGGGGAAFGPDGVVRTAVHCPSTAVGAPPTAACQTPFAVSRRDPRAVAKPLKDRQGSRSPPGRGPVPVTPPPLPHHCLWPHCPRPMSAGPLPLPHHRLRQAKAPVKPGHFPYSDTGPATALLAPEATAPTTAVHKGTDAAPTICRRPPGGGRAAAASAAGALPGAADVAMGHDAATGSTNSSGHSLPCQPSRWLLDEPRFICSRGQLCNNWMDSEQMVFHGGGIFKNDTKVRKKPHSSQEWHRRCPSAA